LKTAFHNGRSAGNIVKNWREITLKNSSLLFSAALKIIFKNISIETYLPEIVCLLLRLSTYLPRHQYAENTRNIRPTGTFFEIRA
jgi:hypothetical protein